MCVWDSPKAGCHFSPSAVAEPKCKGALLSIVADFGSEVRILPTVSSSSQPNICKRLFMSWSNYSLSLNRVIFGFNHDISRTKVSWLYFLLMLEKPLYFLTTFSCLTDLFFGDDSLHFGASVFLEIVCVCGVRGQERKTAVLSYTTYTIFGCFLGWISWQPLSQEFNSIIISLWF